MTTHQTIAESGRYFDIWTWTNGRGLYRCVGIGQAIDRCGRFAFYDRTNIPAVDLVKIACGPWVAFWYRGKTRS